MNLSKTMSAYFDYIDSYTKKAYDLSGLAREKGYDPEPKVEIPLAKDMAERVESLISVTAPQIKGSGVSERIKELEEKYSVLDWRIALTIAAEIADGKFVRFSSRHEAAEVGIRVGFAYLTLGTVSSPLEGFVKIKEMKRKDQKPYWAIFYSGPIRSAGGTAAAVSVILADHLRKKFGIEPYDPTPDEVERMVTELYDYHDRVTNLQYLPSEEEIRFLVKHLPLQIDGDPSERIEVSNHKDLPRIETNRIRNGACLVIGECLAQKAQKLLAQLNKWGKDFDLQNWEFLKEFAALQKKMKAKGTETKAKISPIYTYIQDLVAGRPVLTHPLRQGGFRLRYGRSRNSGYSSACLHPATTYLLNRYIAIGTQLKVERPGKATSLSCCDSIEGPIIKLKNQSVLHIEDAVQARQHADEVEEILFMGDILFNYGDFFNRAHPLAPAGYCEEWYALELEKAILDIFGSLDLGKAASLAKTDEAFLKKMLADPFYTKPDALTAIQWSVHLHVPLHPRYTYHWNNASLAQFRSLALLLKEATLEKKGEQIVKIILPFEAEAKRALEVMGVPHLLVNNEFIVLEKDHAFAFGASLGLDRHAPGEVQQKLAASEKQNPLDIVNGVSPFVIRDKSGTFIGARMGRPEKAKMRKLTGSPHVLFPVGEEGGKLRSFQSALMERKITADFPVFFCASCNKETPFSVCEMCRQQTKQAFHCHACGVLVGPECPKHGKAQPFRNYALDINHYFTKMLNMVGFTSYPDLIKGVKGTSNEGHVPESLAKGILRAHHEIYVNKDGTTRYDMTQLAITHFKPVEVHTSIEKLISLGYDYDIYGNPLLDENQVMELRPQDIILPACPDSPDEGADKVLFRTASFIDDLLKRLYGVAPFYNLKDMSDLAGHLVIALAPHTSAAMVGRIIGFSKTQGFYAHPFLHAATRRDCDGDEASVILLMDALLNFSRHFLPKNLGSTQDTPLVITSHLVPAEVDDMVFDIDVVWKYPLAFYEATLEYKMPWDVKIEKIGDRLHTPDQYEKMGFTHPLTNINHGVKCSAYKTLPSMEEKLKGQMDLAEKIRAVDASDVAALVIQRHFLPDIRGNLRKFSQQEFRCVKCNDKYRRPPLMGKCTRCGGQLLFTVSEGSIIKYLEPAMSLGKKYMVSPYLTQTLELTQRHVDGVFGKEKDRQEGLGRWFG